ncbi:glycoside hydrolase family 88/105 protein [Terriglobus sp.]|uniref:glycoside hydrolase family 88/105 protein n=1 Tax=Terriglobus sp. TaxID=1889013 RepID=UPI003AFF6780
MNLTRRSLSHMLVGSAAAAFATPGLRAQAGQTTTAPHENMAAPEPMSAADRSSLQHFPKGYTPQEAGKAVAEHFVPSAHYHADRIVYPEVCAWYGALEFARVTKDQELLDKLRARFDPLLGSEAPLLPPQGEHVDFSMFGALPLELYILTQDKRYLDLGLQYADKQWQKPDAQGLTGETRFWVDDMYMITIVQVQAYRATKDTKYLDRAALEAAAYLDKLQQPNGLFFHAPDVPFFWGRGNGWFAVGMAELLRDLPASHPRHARILQGYRTMLGSLLRYQGKDGMWRQLIDHDEAWPETSGTGMFSFAMVTGVKHGWLDQATYAPAARAAWMGLVGFVDQNSNVTCVCEGTNKLNSLEYYLLRKRRTGDFHGQAPLLWTAAAMLRG